MSYETILYETGDDKVATVTLNRPDSLNAFNQQMCEEFLDVWRTIRHDDDIHAVVLRAAGDRAFCTGVDRKAGLQRATNVWNHDDPGEMLGPKHNRVWKPVIIALHGMVAGGAMYWVNDSDIVICSDDAQFFDPHVTYGMTSALEPIGFAQRAPLGEVLRWALMGLDERMSAQRAYEIGLVSEITKRDELWIRAHEIAAIISAKPTAATQGTVRAIWESKNMTRQMALENGMHYTQLGNPIGTEQVDPNLFTSGKRPPVRLR
jgi:enoyl-CoA hydratase/carnithine racemase